MTAGLTAVSADFLLTSLIVILAPGAGVIYTVSHGVFLGAQASMVAAFGATLGIIPHILASLFGLAALLHASAVAFELVRIAGVAYLLYLAWGILRDRGSLAVTRPDDNRRSGVTAIITRGVLINSLNPKLSMFFLAFLPQFVPAAGPNVLMQMAMLSAVFMALTLVVFIGYGLAANAVRVRVLSSSRITRWVRRTFAAAFAGFAVKLALTDR